MDKNSIIHLPHPNLRKVSQKVTVIDDNVLNFIEQMKEATIDWESHRDHEVSVGLAAVQVDTLLKIFIVREDFEDKSNTNFIAFINPEIIKREGQIITEHEGCLSVPDIYGMVPRHETVKMRALDKEGKQFTVKVSGYPARILQHELDHTKGKLFVDVIEKNKDAFMKLNAEGGMEKVDYDYVKTLGILR